MRAGAPSPSCPREIKIAGTMVQLERLIGMRDIHICRTRESIEIQVLSRGNVVTQFQIAIIERNIGEVAAQPIAYQPPDITLAERSQPVSTARLAKSAFAQKLAVGNARSSAKHRSSAAAFAGLIIQRRADLIAKLFWICNRQQLHFLHGLTGQQAE